MAIIFNKAVCPNCGAGLKLNKDTGIAECKHCGTDFIMEETNGAHVIGSGRVASTAKVMDAFTVKLPKLTVGNSKIAFIAIIVFCIICITALVSGIVLMSIYSNNYRLELSDGTTICSDLHKNYTMIGHEHFEYKFAYTDNMNIVNQYLYIKLDGMVYELYVGEHRIIDDSIYFHNIPNICASINCPSAILYKTIVNKEIVIISALLIAAGLLNTCVSFGILRKKFIV